MTLRDAGGVACAAAAAILGSSFSCGGSDASERPQVSLDLAIRSSADKAADEAGVDLERLVTRSAEEIAALIPLRRPVRIELKVDAERVIPETGVGGSAWCNGVVVALERPLRPGTATRLRATLAHELHHVSRCRTGPSFRGTLAEALVLEGLADRFVEEAFPALPPQPWNEPLSEELEASLWRRARPHLWTPRGYDHASWFFGGDGFPRWAGYRLGHRIVGAYLRGGRLASDGVAVEARTVIGAYVRRRGG